MWDGLDDPPSLYADPGFDVVGLSGALSLFEYYLDEKAPALRMLYMATCDGGEAEWEYACTPSGDNDFRLLEARTRRMQVADSAAGSFLLLTDTLLESLSAALYRIQTGNIRKTRTFAGPRFADILQAAGNFVRHSAEWGSQARDAHDLSSLRSQGRRSVEILGATLDPAEGDLVDLVLGRSWRMFRLMHMLFGEETSTSQHPTFQAFEAVERSIRDAAKEIVARARAAQEATSLTST